MTKKTMVAEMLMNDCFGGKDPQSDAKYVARWTKEKVEWLYNECVKNWEKFGREWKKA